MQHPLKCLSGSSKPALLNASLDEVHHAQTYRRKFFFLSAIPPHVINIAPPNSAVPCPDEFSIAARCASGPWACFAKLNFDPGQNAQSKSIKR